MKTFFALFLLTFVFTVTRSLAIPVLTQANSAPAIGDVFISYNIDTTAQPGSEGPSQTWIFDNLNINSSETRIAEDPATTPNANFFQTANVALSSAGNYKYMNSSASSLVQLGESGSGQIQIINQGIEYFNYPFTFNSVAGTSNFNGTHVQGTFTGSSETVGDAYGTLIIDGQVFPDVLRIHVVQDIDYDYTGLGHIVYHTVTYSWYDGIHKNPVMQIRISEFNGVSSGYNKTVSVASFVTSSRENISPVSFIKIFPNPARENSNISFSLSKPSEVVIKIYNSIGDQILSTNLGMISTSAITEALDVKKFVSGIYLIDIIVGGRSNYRKIVVG